MYNQYNPDKNRHVDYSDYSDYTDHSCEYTDYKSDLRMTSIISTIYVIV